MAEQDRRVFPNDPRLTDADFRAATAAMLLRLSRDTPLARLALIAGCDERTLRNARDERATLKAPTLFNLLAHCPSALDEILAGFGLRLVPAEPQPAPEAALLARTAGLAAAQADALADGRIDHREERELAEMARPVVRAWGARVARVDAARGRKG